MELKPVSPTAKAPAQNFTGNVYVNQVKVGQWPNDARVVPGPLDGILQGRLSPFHRTPFTSGSAHSERASLDSVGWFTTLSRSTWGPVA